MYRYYRLHKPYGYLSQFTQEVEGQKTLSDILEVDKDVYPIGRLDKDSEGILLLTNNRSVTQRLLHPKYAHRREYWVQVEGEISERALDQLRKGVSYRTKKKQYHSKVESVQRIPLAPLPARKPPIRERAEIPTSWISMTLTEGKHRQVRKMCAAVGFPVLRLIRYAIHNLTIEGLANGRYEELNESVFFRLAGIVK
jgi:23S rRNA pseudouridine2457 synthase